MSDENEAAEGLNDNEIAAAKREAALNPVSIGGTVDALLVERHGYAVRDLPDRVAEVDEQLRLRGVEPPADADGDNSRTATRRGRGKGRTAEA